MVALGLFDGMSCGQIALERANIPVEMYYASEIDKYAIQVTQKNYPDTIQLRDITKWQEWDIEAPDLILAGSPCQGFSFAGKQLNFKDERSKLFFVFIDILKHYKPKYFLLENVVMAKEHNDVISRILGELYPDCVEQTELFQAPRLEPIQINSALVSAQNRQRLYWTNIQGIEQPKDKGILLKDIIDNNCAIKSHGKYILKNDKSQCIDANYWKGIDNHGQRTVVIRDATYNNRPARIYDKKCPTLRSANAGFEVKSDVSWRKLTPLECERLQTAPEKYTETEGVSNSQRYKMLGNGWTVDVIAHILSYMEIP